MSALHGDIEEGVLANLLQYLSLSQASGCLTLRHPARARGDVYLEDGRVVFVDASPFHDVAALSELMRWRDGRFSFRSGVPAPRRSLTDSTERLLLEVSHRHDTERSALAAGASLAPDAVLAALTPPELGQALVSLSALHVWRALDGQSALSTLAGRAGLPLKVVLSGAEELVDLGLAYPAGEAYVDPVFVDELTREAVDILGPVAEVFVEDALFELGLDQEMLAVAALDDLITTVATQFRRSEWQLDFLRRAERLRLEYGLGA